MESLRANSVELHRIQFLFLAILVVVTGAAFALIGLHRYFPVQPIRADLIIPAFHSFVLPKPTEQFVFVVLAGATPVLAWLLVTFWRPSLPGRAARTGLAIAVPAILTVPLVGSDFLVTLAGEFGEPGSHTTRYLIAALVFAALACGIAARSRWRFPFPIAAAWVIFIGAVLAQLFAWRLVGIASITRSSVWSVHADPVYYALSQVVGGKTLLIDLPSQYGMFPELLAPLFRLIGLSVFKLSAAFAVMQIVSLAALFAVLAKLVRSTAILLATGLALVMATFETVLFFGGIEERYYQYWPIRVFWPALSVAGFWWFLRRRTLRRSAAMSLLSAAGLIWNLDSGLFISVVFAAYLVTRAITRPRAGRDEWPLRRYAAALVIHGVVTAGCIGAFWAVLVLTGDGPIDPFWLFGYQKIFYGLGLMMLPLPRALHPWMSVLGIYLVALIAAISAFRARPPAIRDDMLFYLSMLGLGLFVYYEGRSHVLNLVTVCWPAVLILGIGSDHLLRAVRARALPLAQLASPVAAIAVLVLASGTLLLHTPSLARDAAHRLATRGVPDEAFVQSELALIRRNSKPGQACLILSQRQGIYYAETGLVSPVRGPGLVELLLQSEQDAFVAKFLSGSLDCVFYGIGGFTDAGLKLPMSSVLDRYRVADRNKDDTMLYLVPKED